MTTEDPLEDSATDKGAGVLGLGSIVLAATIALSFTIFLIWRYDLSAFWAILFYPLIGTVLTFAFSALNLLLRGPRSGGVGGKLASMRRSWQVPLRSHEQTPPR